jgi:hypothetical protein
MLITQAELFWGLNHDFVEQVMADASKETRSEGDILFLTGEKADYFYTLIKGRVKLSIGVFWMVEPGRPQRVLCFGRVRGYHNSGKNQTRAARGNLFKISA